MIEKLTDDIKGKLSNMMKHYCAVKEQYDNCILFYRLGDFYEMFFDDAVKVSRMLDLTLTGRECGLNDRAAMCGVPFHAADTYIAKLVELGERIAICDQLTEPKPGKALVERDVVRIVSAGTLTDESMLDEKKNNYLACVYKDEEAVALAWADITTGEFFVEEYVDELAMESCIGNLLKLSVAEIICNEEMLFEAKDFREVRHGLLPAFSCYVPWAFNVKHAESNLLKQFNAASLSAYGLNGKERLIVAAGALVEYLKETQKSIVSNINSITVVERNDFMILDSIAVRNLELLKNNAENKKYGSLLWLLDKTSTGMGARLLTQTITSPLKDVEQINYRLDGVEELVNASVARMGIADSLKDVADVNRLAGKIANANFSPRDGLALAKSLLVIPSVKFKLSGFSSRIIRDVDSELIDLKELAELLTNSIDENAPALVKDGGYIRAGFNSELDELRAIRKNVKGVLDQLEARERERTGIKTLKIGYNRVFGYYMEVSNSFKDKTPPEYIRKQTLTTGERFITEELKILEEKILTSEEKALKLEAQIYASLLDVLHEHIDALKQVASSFATLDCLVALATVAKERRYVRPKILPAGGALSIKEGRHPVIEALSKERFVPNDAYLDNDENRSAIITGPNMAGKSTYMRQVALIVLMAHLGSFVPAKSAEIPLTDRIFTRVGASDNLIFDQSTFMVEMTEVATILRHATRDSLLILDEVGRGTSTYDGLSIAWSVVEYLTERVCAKTLFATHYHELTELEKSMSGVKNYKVTVKEVAGSVVFLRKIVRGGANRSFGVEVASLAGVPKEITNRAKAILRTLEKKEISKERLDYFSEIEEAAEETKSLSEVEEILASTDVNTLSPMQALLLLNDLKNKINSEN